LFSSRITPLRLKKSVSEFWAKREGEERNRRINTATELSRNEYLIITISYAGIIRIRFWGMISAFRHPQMIEWDHHRKNTVIHFNAIERM
jgi:hypothetical protein